MATKKEAAAQEEVRPQQEEAKAENAAKPKDAWEEEVTMVVPRKPRGEDQQYYICVNDRRYLVPADGKVQKLPRPVAEVLQESLQADAEADDFADHIPNRSGEQPQNHAIG